MNSTFPLTANKLKNSEPFPVGRAILGMLVLAAQQLSGQTWFSTLDPALQQSILWSADVETGNLWQWTYAPDGMENPNAGGGVYNTGGAAVTAAAVTDIVHSGQYAVMARITGAINGTTRAVRLLRRTDKPWDQGGSYFPNAAYYSTWLYVPHTYSPRRSSSNSGWWNIFQFKSSEWDEAQQKNVSVPVWVLNLTNVNGEMRLYFYSNYNPPNSFIPNPPVVVPVAQWTHLEVFYEISKQPTGRVILWVNGHQILDLPQVITSTIRGPGGFDAEFGIGNYTNHVTGHPNEPGRADLYFDDAAVSLRRLGTLHPPRPNIVFTDNQVRFEVPTESKLRYRLLRTTHLTEAPWLPVDNHWVEGNGTWQTLQTAIWEDGAPPLAFFRLEFQKE